MPLLITEIRVKGVDTSISSVIFIYACYNYVGFAQFLIWFIFDLICLYCYNLIIFSFVCWFCFVCFPGCAMTYICCKWWQRLLTSLPGYEYCCQPTHVNELVFTGRRLTIRYCFIYDIFVGRLYHYVYVSFPYSSSYINGWTQISW